MRILVTGATGFAGRHLANVILSLGHELHALVRPKSVPTVPGDWIPWPASMTDLKAVRDVIGQSRPDRVIHLAGASSVGASFGEPLAVWDINLGGTVTLLEALRLVAPETRCVVVSSGEIYGRVPLDALPVTEATPLRPLSPYGASKAAADLAAGQYRSGYGMPVLRVRAFNHVGPGQDARFVVSSVARQIALAERLGQGSAVVRAGNLKIRRDFTDVRDMVDAYWRVAERGDPDRPYLACSGRSVPVTDLVAGLAGLARIPVQIVSDEALRRAGEQEDLYGDPCALEHDVGWRATRPLTDTLRDALDWWRDAVTKEAEG